MWDGVGLGVYVVEMKLVRHCPRRPTQNDAGFLACYTNMIYYIISRQTLYICMYYILTDWSNFNLING